MSAGTHVEANSVDAKPRRRMIWIFGGAATAVVVGGLLMQYFRAIDGRAATDPPTGSAGTARVAKKPEVVARVGKEQITYDMVAAECFSRIGKEVLDDLIHRMIIAHACEAEKITVSEAEVSEEINRIAKKFNMDLGTYLSMLQAERNITPMQYRASVVWPMLAMKKLTGESIEISDEDMQKAFARNYGPRVKARIIVLNDMRTGSKVWEEASKDPDNFDKLAQQYSVDPGSRALGGQVPPIPRFTGNDKLEQEAFKLKKGEISGLVQMGTRFVILKCEGRTDPVVTDIEEVRDTLYDELKETKTQQAVGKKFEQIKEKTQVDNYLTMSSTRPERTPATPGGQLITAPKGPQNAPGDIVPVNATQPARPTNTTSAPVRSSRN